MDGRSPYANSFKDLEETPQTEERVRIPRSRKAGKFTEPKKDPMTRTEYAIRTEIENYVREIG